MQLGETLLAMGMGFAALSPFMLRHLWLAEDSGELTCLRRSAFTSAMRSIVPGTLAILALAWLGLTYTGGELSRYTNALGQFFLLLWILSTVLLFVALSVAPAGDRDFQADEVSADGNARSASSFRSFLLKVAISTIGGFLSSAAAFYLGFSNEITLLSAPLGAFLVFSVSAVARG